MKGEILNLQNNGFVTIENRWAQFKELCAISGTRVGLRTPQYAIFHKQMLPYLIDFFFLHCHLCDLPSSSFKSRSNHCWFEMNSEANCEETKRTGSMESETYPSVRILWLS